MAAYRRVYDSRHLQADCQEPGSAPEPHARQSSMSYLLLLLITQKRTHKNVLLCSLAVIDLRVGHTMDVGHSTNSRTVIVTTHYFRADSIFCVLAVELPNVALRLSEFYSTKLLN